MPPKVSAAGKSFRLRWVQPKDNKMIACFRKCRLTESEFAFDSIIAASLTFSMARHPGDGASYAHTADQLSILALIAHCIHFFLSVSMSPFDTVSSQTVFSVFLIIANIACFITSTVDGWNFPIFDKLEDISVSPAPSIPFSQARSDGLSDPCFGLQVVIFTVEYLLRLYACTEDPEHQAWLCPVTHCLSNSHSQHLILLHASLHPSPPAFLPPLHHPTSSLIDGLFMPFVCQLTQTPRLASPALPFRCIA